MHRILMVVRREYLERIRKKSFWIGTLVFPILMMGMIFVPMMLIGVKTGDQKKIAVIDATGKLLEPLREGLVGENLKDGRPQFILEEVPIHGSLDETRSSLEPRISSKELFAIMTIGGDIDAVGNYRLYGRNVGNIMATRTLSRALRNGVVGLRLEKMELDLDRKSLDRLTAPVPLETFQITSEGEAKRKGFNQAYFGTFAFVMLLYFTLVIYGVAAMRGIIEEKSSRIMEVLLGSLTPHQIMTGKILGIGLVGLTQIAVYAVTAGWLRVYVAARQLQGDWTAMLDTFSMANLFYFVLYFVLGYFLFVTLFAAVGAVCNTEQEAQNLQSPLIMCLIVPMASTFFFVSNPDSTIAVVISLIPLFTPMVMFMRISLLTPPLWQIGLSIVLMAGTIYVLFHGVAKIFRIGTLMYGKRPSLVEIFRWARS